MFSIYYFRHCSIVFHFNIFLIVFKMYFLLLPSFPQFFSSFAIFSLIFSQLFLFFWAFFSNLFALFSQGQVSTELHRTPPDVVRLRQKMDPELHVREECRWVWKFPREFRGFLSMAEKGIEEIRSWKKLLV